MQTRTVEVGNISDLASEREIREFFSFSGEIDHIEMRCDPTASRCKAFVTFKDPKALEIALLLSGATIVDQMVSIRPVQNYTPEVQEVVASQGTSDSSDVNCLPSTELQSSPFGGGRIYVSKAQEVVSGMLAKGSAIGQDAMNRARAFDEKHQLRANASAKVISFDRRVGLSEKITVGISVVNEKVKSVDQKLHVSDKTMAALIVAERKLNDTGSAVKTNRYVTTGTAWLNGAFSKVAKAGHVAGTRTRETFQLAVSNLTAKDPVIAA
ncbi:putative RNA recognition motif domain, nucleotide-binding alpha-beta plait domain superfamily [Dioscorea sansibarensis]